MITFKENTFVKGTYDELMEMAKAIEEKGGKIKWDLLSKDSNHLWFGTFQKSWEFDNNLQRKCYHELTKSQLYEAYGIVDFSILNESDVFYVEFINGEKWLYQGENPLNFCKRKSVDLLGKHTYSGDSGCLESRKNRYKLIRLATTEEIEPYKEHFKLNNMEKQPKFKEGDTVRCIGEDGDITSSGWKKGKEFIVDEIILHNRPLYFPKEGAGVWEEHLELVSTTETRPIKISKETATHWYNGEDNELKQLAIQTYPELDEASPKVGDLCLFRDDESDLNKGIGLIGTLKSQLSNNEFKFQREEGGVWKYCKKIKSIELY